MFLTVKTGLLKLDLNVVNRAICCQCFAT